MEKIFYISLLLFFSLYIPADAEIIKSRSSSKKDVQAAVISAQNDDTVLVPVGQSKWNEKIEINKGIMIRGAGKGNTIIENGGFLVNGKEGRPFRISGFTFNSGHSTYGSTTALTILGNCKNFRIDNCQFNNDVCQHIIYIHGATYGVIDHCDFINSKPTIFEALEGDAPWKRPLALGKEDKREKYPQAVYVENCYFYNDVHCNCIDSNGGARWVFRYNTVINSYCEAHGLQNKNQRGTFSYEIYGNTFKTLDNGKNNIVVINVRGGTGVIFNNVVINEKGDPFNTFCVIQENRSCGYPYTKSWGECDGTTPCDGNTPDMAGYPCRDQIGRSTDAGPDKVHPQTHEPLYAWNNTMDGVLVGIKAVGCERSKFHIKEGRDFINKKRPGYEPYTYPHPLVKEDDE